MASSPSEPPQGILVNKELATQLQRLGAKFQSFDLTYVELKEQVENVAKTLIARVKALEAEKAELQAKLEKHEKPKAQP